MHRTPLPALVAPTGAGKTASLLALADSIPLAVLSADSVQAIRGFDIGSAKPDAAERARLPHHLIDVIEPTERYDAWRFAQDAMALLEDPAAERPLVATAGTALYLTALSEGLRRLPDVDPDVQAELAATAKADPPAAHARLRREDPASARRIHPNDWRRTSRALAIAAATDRPASVALAEAPRVAGPPLRLFGIWAEGPDYEAVLADRIDRMLAAGWIEEVEGLVAEHGWELPGLEAVGYAEIAAMLRGRLPRGKLAERILIATRRYAKRQRTWFRRRPVQWFPFAGGGPPPGLAAAFGASLDISYNEGR